MVDLDQVRAAIIGLVVPSFSVAFPGVPLVVDNEPFDRNNLPAQFVDFEIKFYAGNQIGMAANPKTRQRGFVYVCVHQREGEGSKQVLTMLKWFGNALEYKTPSTANTRTSLQAAEAVGSDEVKGWYTEEMKVGFYVDPV